MVCSPALERRARGQSHQHLRKGGKEQLRGQRLRRREPRALQLGQQRCAGVRLFRRRLGPRERAPFADVDVPLQGLQQQLGRPGLLPPWPLAQHSRRLDQHADMLRSHWRWEPHLAGQVLGSVHTSLRQITVQGADSKSLIKLSSFKTTTFQPTFSIQISFPTLILWG